MPSKRVLSSNAPPATPKPSKMWRKPMPRKSVIAAILICARLTACSTRQTPRTVSDHCLIDAPLPYTLVPRAGRDAEVAEGRPVRDGGNQADSDRSEEHTSELQSLMRISYAVFCLKK